MNGDNRAAVDAARRASARRAEGFAATVAGNEYHDDGTEHVLSIRFSCDPAILRAEAMRLRELCWMDAEDWAAEHGGVEAIPVTAALYEIILASSPDPVAPMDRGFEVIDTAGA